MYYEGREKTRLWHHSKSSFLQVEFEPYFGMDLKCFYWIDVFRSQKTTKFTVANGVDDISMSYSSQGVKLSLKLSDGKIIAMIGSTLPQCDETDIHNALINFTGAFPTDYEK